ncbi:ABC transporter substrate-binding protein [Corynebacterium freiburgense]|uniref:ABC transporter substrate-binding protein n=1 Tax=Corynebacterium freiburgense TaxID=556548 RepID=UPI0003F4F720|nr:ABC transporter substrate-binding protein [Corynebacterium freiburgense]WJZ03801.1 maltose ABC transporter periplasmic protein [Corynebacterium freiburgense]
MVNKRILATLVAGAVAASGLVACSGSGDDGKPGVYFLNFKPEQEAVYKKIAEAYTKETGVPVKVVTAASGNYEQTLKSEIDKSDAPTLYQLNGPVGLKNWQKYAVDLSDAEITKALKDDVPALKGEDGKVYGVPFAVEGYGIIYNEEILDKYFKTSGAKASSVEDIKDFATLKAVAEDMQSKKSALGIDGVFASTSLATGEDWRWYTHLANLPVHYELKDLGVQDSDELKFKYNKEYKNIFDLYLNNSTIEKTLAPSKSVTDSMAEFAQGKAAMVQNGNWAWGQINEVSGNVVKEDKIKFMPIYTGMKGEESQGLAVGTENYLAVNNKASEEDQKATIDFVNWLFTSDAGKKHVVEDLGFIAPFTNYTESDTPNDPLAKEIAAAINDDSLTNVPWDFQYFPSQQFKDDFGQALGQYASGNINWDEVVKTFVDNWAAEKAASK